jgi:hypothetical protein
VNSLSQAGMLGRIGRPDTYWRVVKSRFRIASLRCSADTDVEVGREPPARELPALSTRDVELVEERQPM